MSAAYALAAFVALIARPECGGRTDPDIVARLAVNAEQESGFNPYLIGIKGHALPPFPDAASAARAARELDASGIDFDAGLFQINRRQFARHGLTIETAFDPCRNAAAGSAHFLDDFRVAWTYASRRYNCGGFDCSADYASRADARYAGMVQAIRALRGSGLPAPATPVQPASPPALPPSSPYPDWQTASSLDYAITEGTP